MREDGSISSVSIIEGMFEHGDDFDDPMRDGDACEDGCMVLVPEGVEHGGDGVCCSDEKI